MRTLFLPCEAPNVKLNLQDSQALNPSRQTDIKRAAAQGKGPSRHFHTVACCCMESSWKYRRWRKNELSAFQGRKSEPIRQGASVSGL